MLLTTKNVKHIWAILFCIVISLGLFTLIFVKPNKTEVVNAEESLVDLTNTSVLTDKFNSIGANFSTLDGTVYNPSSNPYKISDANDLIRLSYYVNIAHNEDFASASYILTSHINLSGYNWAPIGGLSSGLDVNAIPFCGVFNGNGYSIYGLTINLFYKSDYTFSNTSNSQDEILLDTTAGLFGFVSYYVYTDSLSVVHTCNPVIKLLGLYNTKINTNAYYTGAMVGSFVGDANPSTTIDITSNRAVVADAVASAVMQECYNTGFVHGGTYVGGLCGAVKDGAVVYNCYNSQGESVNIPQVSYGVDNTLGNIAVYAIDSEACVGGLVGKAVEISSSCVVSSSINTASVARLNSGANVGGIVGVCNIAKDKYQYNFYFGEQVYTTETTQAGISRTLSQLAPSSIGSYNNRYSITYMSTGTYTPYTRGDTPTSIWRMGPSVNNGFPYLVRVNPLAKVELNIQSLNGNAPATVNFSGFDTLGQETTTIHWYTPVIIAGNQFYIEQGKSVVIETAVSGAEYKFVEWQSSTIATNIAESKDSVVGEYQSPTLFITTDCVYTAVYDYMFYTISAFSNDANYGSVSIQNPLNNNLSSIVWADVNAENTSSTQARIGDYIKLTALPKAGYMLDTVTSNLGTTLTIDNNSVILNVSGNENISFVFVAKTYSITVNNPQDASLNNLVTTKFSVNGGAEVEQVLNAAFGSAVNINVYNIDSNYSLGYYSISADNMPTLNLNTGVSTFVIEDYNNYVITPVLIKKSYTVTLNVTTDKYTAKFTNPNVSVLQTNIDFDGEFTINLENIATGYHFVSWQLNYLGDSSEVWDLTSTTITKQGLSGNVTLTPVIQINKYLVTLTAGANGSISYNGGEVEYNSNIESVATPNYGYVFVNWTDSLNNIISTNATLNRVITSAFDATANFKLASFSVIFAGVGDDNAIFNTNFVNQTNNSGVYNYDDDVSFSIICPAGYEFKNWQITSNSANNLITLNNDGTGSIQNLRSDVYITAFFKVKTYLVTFSINNANYGDFRFNYNGWTVYSDSNIDQAFEYKYKDVLQVILLDASQTKNPNIAKRYIFSHFIINGVPYKDGNTINMPIVKNTSVQAIFRPAEYKIEVTKNIPDSAAVSGVYNKYYPYGTTLQLNVVVNSGYQFIGWYNYNKALRQEEFISSNKELSILVDGEKDIICKTAHIGYIIAEVNDEQAGYVSGMGNYNIGTVVTLVATANQGYKFSGWQKDGQIVSTNNQLSLTVGQTSQQYKAIFSPLFTVKIVTNNTKYGSVEVSGNNGLGDQIILTATANNNCSFVGWSYDDQIISTDKQFNLTMLGDLSIKAVFERNFDYSIIIIAGGCVLFVILLLIIVVQYIKAKEAEPLKTRFILQNSDDEYDLPKKKKANKNTNTRNVRLDEIEPIPVRKNTSPLMEYKNKKEDKKQK